MTVELADERVGVRNNGGRVVTNDERKGKQKGEKCKKYIIKCNMDGIDWSFPTLGKPHLDALLLYFNFFLSRYVGNDVQYLCGNMFDTPVAKTVILFAIMYSGSRDVKVALVMTAVCLTFQYVMSRCVQCAPYVEKNKHSKTEKSVWVTNLDG